jgi:SMC interacting uncharacterized protein involved in chromosome segregation
MNLSIHEFLKSDFCNELQFGVFLQHPLAEVFVREYRLFLGFDKNNETESIEELKDTIEELKGDIEDKDSEIDDLEETIKELKEQIEELESKEEEEEEDEDDE